VTPPPATVGELLGDRVHGVETFLVDGGPAKSWVWVRLQSTDGVVGWGECYTAPGREPAIRALAGELGRSLAGREVGAIRHFTSLAYRDFATKRGSLELSCAVSGLEQAMWDVLGKTLGRPVHALLGGPCRERFRVYANGWSYGASGDTADLAAAVARAQELVAAGWSALKFDPFQGPWRPYVGRDEVRAAVECVAAVREAVGPGVDLLVEVHRRLAPPASMPRSRWSTGRTRRSPPRGPRSWRTRGTPGDRSRSAPRAPPGWHPAREVAAGGGSAGWTPSRPGARAG